MADHRITPSGNGPKQSWPGYVQFLFVVMLTLVFFLLAQGMKRHHFLDGGRDRPIRASRQ
jgi:hypothetical protein